MTGEILLSNDVVVYRGSGWPTQMLDALSWSKIKSAEIRYPATALGQRSSMELFVYPNTRLVEMGLVFSLPGFEFVLRVGGMIGLEL